MITVSMLIHWILLVIFIGSCIFLFLGFAGSVLLLQWISYTAWRDPSTTMWEKISITPWAILGLIMEVGSLTRGYRGRTPSTGRFPDGAWLPHTGDPVSCPARPERRKKLSRRSLGATERETCAEEKIQPLMKIRRCPRGPHARSCCRRSLGSSGSSRLPIAAPRRPHIASK